MICIGGTGGESRDHIGRFMNEPIELDITPHDLEALQARMHSWLPFVTTGLDIEDPYDLIEYAYSAQYTDFDLQAMLDRNLVSCVCRLARGDSVPRDAGAAETFRVAAACMVYLITGNATCDATMAMHELADQQGSRAANNDLFAFRIADHIPYQTYLNVALGRNLNIPSSARQHALQLVLPRYRDLPEHDFSTKLQIITRHQICLTKICLIEKSGGSGREKLLRYLDWTISEAFSNAAAISFARIFFAKNRPSGMIRWIDGRSVAGCLRGIRNAAWDLAYMSDWGRRVGQENERLGFILCSRDALLTRIIHEAPPIRPE